MYKEGDMAMKESSMRYRMILFVTGVCFSGVVFDSTTVFGQSPTVTFRARKHNDTIISSDPFLGDVATVDNVSPGDTVEIDMFVSDWGDVGDGTLRGYQIIPAVDSFVHDLEIDCLFLPVGWDAPPVTQNCLIISQCSAGTPNAGLNCCSDDDCPDGTCESSSQCQDDSFPICNQCPVEAGAKRCTGLNFDPTQGAFIKDQFCSAGSNIGNICTGDSGCPGGACIDNTNFIFHAISPSFFGVTTSTYEEYTYGGLAFTTCIVDTNELRYAGTLILEAKAGATGTFRIVSRVLQEGEPGTSPSFVESCNGLPVESSSSALTINMVNPESCLPGCIIAASDPPNCAIDARYPWPPDDIANKLSWNSIDITVVGNCPSVLTTDDFAVRFEGGAGFPIITDVTNLGGQEYRVTFSQAPRPTLWACIDLLVDDPIETTCIGTMPGDANSDRTSDADDVQAMIDHLNSPSLSIWQCDADRSGSCQPADVLSVIDMLNGADTFFPGWDGDSIIACPSQ